MTRCIRRVPEFEIKLEISQDDFIRPPRDAQRTWLLNRAMKEFCDNLQELDAQARGYVRGADITEFTDRTQARLGDQEIMEDWQVPLMKAMARHVTESHGEVLEVGFGRGVAAELIQRHGVRSHTIVEMNDHSVHHHFEPWRKRHAEADIRLLHARSAQLKSGRAAAVPVGDVEGQVGVVLGGGQRRDAIEND